MSTKESSKTIESPNLSRREAAEYLGISIRTLDNLKADGSIHFLIIRSRILFRQQDLDDYVEKQLRKAK